MSGVAAIAGRELRAYFLSPGGYIITALFLLVTGLFFFFGGFEQGQVASMRSVFGIGTWMLSFIAPAITMRLFSEEYRLGTWEMLMTCPLREGEAVLGKFVGAMAFLILMLVPTLVYLAALEMFGRPDYGEVASGYLGLVLAGSAYVASGLLASTMTSSQPVAFLLALFFWLTLGIGTKFLPQHVNPTWAAGVYAADPDLRLKDFAIGLIDSSNIVYFLSITVLCLVVAARTLECRRWG